MKVTKYSLFAIFPLLLASCSSYGSHYLMKDLDGYVNEKVFKTFDINQVEKMMSSNNEFMIYFSSTGCSSCDTISTVLHEYLPSNRVLIYNLDYQYQREIANLFVQKYPQKFVLEFPSVYIVKGEEVTQIPSTKLNSSTRVSNSFHEYQHECNIYYSDKVDARELISANYKKMPFTGNFAYVAFDFENKSLLDNYSYYLSSYLETINFPVILNNFTAKENEIFVGKYSVDENGSIGCRNQTSTVDFSNIDFVKTVINF